MSLLHDALKKAEKNSGDARPGGGVTVDVEEHAGDRPQMGMLVLSGLASLLLLFIGYQRFVKKPAEAPVAVPIKAIAPASGPADSAKMMEEGAKLIQSERYEDARALLEKAVVSNLSNTQAAEAYNNLAFALKKLGQNEEAFQDYQKALSLNPQCVECRNNLGVLYLASRDFTEAEASFQEAIQMKPEYAEPYFHLALLMEARGDLTGAKNYYGRYAQLAHGVSADFLMKIHERMAALEAK